MRAPTAGRVTVWAARSCAGGDPRAAIAAGVAYVPEDRLGTGVAPSLSIASNLVLKSYRGRAAFARAAAPPAGDPRPRDRADPRYRIAAPGPRRAAPGSSPAATCRRSCSRASSPATATDPVAASPTRGLDVGAIETVHAYLRDAAADGDGVLLISEDLDEILALADRIAVMYEGAIVGEVDAEGRRPSRRSAC